MRTFNRTPLTVPKVETKYRRIQTELPVPESIPILEKLEKYEPQSMLGQPPVIWDRAEGCQIYDRWGNVWLDWSSGVLITNMGHAHPAIHNAISEMLDKKLLSTYVFYHEKRAELVELLAELAPEGLDKVFLLSTGSEAVENALKIARTVGVMRGGREKNILVSFSNAFHGRTLGAQMAGGVPKLKNWIINQDPGFVNVFFPDGFFNKDTRFDLFLETLAKNGVKPQSIAGVITESFQGAGPFFMPTEYAQKLRAFCHENDALLIMDEVQSGFGRSGKMFAFEHYNIVPDLIVCGKGISSSLPISAVIGSADIMDIYKPGSMTSTHSGSPLPVASAVANIKALIDEKVLDHVGETEDRLLKPLHKLGQKYPEHIGAVLGKGLVAGLQMVKPNSMDSDPDIAMKINEACFQKGLLMFAPVGINGQCVKICPPLKTPQDAIEEGTQVLTQVCEQLFE